LTPRVDESDKKQAFLTPRVDVLDGNHALPTSVEHHFNEKHTLSTSVLIARNAESFSFIYAETLDRLGNVRFFDPETDVPDFEGIGLLYLPGGYPEKHLDALVSNTACREAIRAYAEHGGRIIAECGGMMYLCRSIVTDNVAAHADVVAHASQRGSIADEVAYCHAGMRDLLYPMCGVLPYDISARREDRRLSLGYRRFVLDGHEYRGHEFHYTQFLGTVPPSTAHVYDALGRPVATPVFRYKNVLASYTHLYELPLNF
jgi:cobyrinic acid a,c-diamide synthase